MPWSSGTFSRTDGTRNGATVWAQAKAAAVKILSADHDTHDQDLADGINACLKKDGGNSPTANLPMNSHKLTGLAAGTEAGNSVRYEQVALLAVAPTFTVDVNLTDTTDNALEGPVLDLYRSRASRAANDLIGVVKFSANDDGDNKHTYASVYGKIIDETGGTEDGELVIATEQAGTLTDAWRFGLGLYPEGGADPGAGNIAADILQVTNQIRHVGDVDNLISFGTDTQNFQTGGSSRLDISDSGVRMGNANARVTTILDEDDLSSDSATALVTQQSVKAYIDAGTGTAGAQDLWVPAGAMISRSTSGAASGLTESTTNMVMTRTFDFATGSDEFVQFEIRFPKRWNAGTVTFKPHWTAASGSGGVTWAMQGVGFADSDAHDTAFGTAVTVDDTLITALDEHIGPESGEITIAGSPAAGERVVFQIYRDVSDANDTLGVDAKLIGIELTWTSNASNDA